MGEAKRHGRYEVRDTIGRGAMGAVFVGESPTTIMYKIVHEEPVAGLGGG